MAKTIKKNVKIKKNKTKIIKTKSHKYIFSINDSKSNNQINNGISIPLSTVRILP
jgi:hypothetical protein